VQRKKGIFVSITKNMPYSPLEIADHFVRKGIEENKPVTQMQLQKMVYFAHGLSLAKGLGSLVAEPVKAWRFGPVFPTIYLEYKQNGSEPIKKAVHKFMPLEPRHQSVVDEAWDITKNISGENLSNWTHLEGSPWAQTYSETDTNRIITDELIKTYFEGFLQRLTAKANG
jgi:uncharacterized phage-associated protein